VLGTEFEQKEGVFYSDFKNDRLSPNTSGTAYRKMLAGDDMKSRYGKVLLEWNRLTNFVCRIFNVNTRQKAGHKT